MCIGMTPGITGWIRRINISKMSKRHFYSMFLSPTVSGTIMSPSLHFPTSFAPPPFFSFFFTRTIVCILSSVDVIIWAFVLVWQVSRVFYLGWFYSVFTTQAHTQRQTHTHAGASTTQREQPTAAWCVVNRSVTGDSLGGWILLEISLQSCHWCIYVLRINTFGSCLNFYNSINKVTVEEGN